jgi:hypothetical protein
MPVMRRFGWLAALALVLAGLTASAAARRASIPMVTGGNGHEAAGAAGAYGLVEGTPAMKSAGALAFGPGNILFVGDTAAGMVHAIDVQDTATDSSVAAIEIKDIDKKIAAALGTTTDNILIRDMKVHHPSQHVYFSVQRGRGTDAAPVLLRASRDGTITPVAIEGVRYASATLTNMPNGDAKTPWGEPSRPLSITDISFVDKDVFVAGLSNEQFASDLRRIPFPFSKQMSSSTIEVFHTSHNRYETHAPITAFLPITLKGVPTLLAGYGCAPLATFPIASLTDKAHVRGQTLAELGGGSRPLDMITFSRQGKPVVIIANSNRTLMRMNAEDLERASPLTTGVEEAYVSKGVPYQAISIIGVLQLDDLNADHAIAVQRDVERGTLNLTSLPKKWL